MKICLPTAGEKGLTETVYNHFGSAPFFTVYNTDTQTCEVIENGNQHHEHGGCQPVGMLSAYNLDAIMTSGMGGRAVAMFNQSGIKVYKLSGSTVKEAAEKFEADDLVELTTENSCGGHGCH